MNLPVLQSAFVSLVSFQDTVNCDGDERFFLKITKQRPTHCFKTNTQSIQLSCSPATQIGKSKDANIIVILHGEIYDSCLDQASYLADRFAEYGDHFAKEIHGSFTILLIDKARDTVSLITDRINSRRVFYSERQNYYCLSSHLSYQPWDDYPLDLAGIAWYLSNNGVRCHRTLFQGISTFTRATVHQLCKNEIKSQPYWEFKFLQETKRNTIKQFSNDLTDLLKAAVKRRLYDNANPFLSLSAGYDSTGILGILAYDLRIPEVSCFSLEHGIPQPGSDAYQAQLMADKTGYEFRLLETYQGDFIKFITDNAEYSIKNQLSQPCVDFDAWKTLKYELADLEKATIFFGDQCIGASKNYLLTNWDDVLNGLEVYPFERLSFLKTYLPNSLYQQLENGIAEDISSIIQACPSSLNFYDSKDILYINTIISEWLLPMRESFAGQFMNVRYPLLDNDLLDFIASTPTWLRRKKRLFCENVTTRYPQLFSIQRAYRRSNFYVDLDSEYIKNQSLIRELITNQESKLDEIITPDILIKMLDDIVNGALPVSLPPRSPLTGFEKLFRKIAKIGKLDLPYSPIVKPMGAANVLTRLLILRVALSAEA